MSTTSITPAAAPTGGALEKFVCDALRGVGVKVSDLTPEQRVRAIAAPTEKGGLRGKALGTWIVEAKNGSAIIAEARAEQAKVERVERTRKNITRSSDPEAKAACEAAKEFTGVKSPFSPKEGREFLDLIALEQSGATVAIINARTNVTLTLPIEQVRAFAQGHVLDSAEDQKAIRSAMGQLGKETTLWGRKLAGFISVALDAPAA